MYQLVHLLPDWVAWPSKYAAFFAETLILIPLIPLMGFLLNASLRKTSSRGFSGTIACSAAALSFIWTFLCFCAMAYPHDQILRLVAEGQEFKNASYVAEPLHYIYGSWIKVGGFSCDFGFLLDPLSGVLALVVTGVGTLIHIYSMGYMAHDRSHARFFCYLNLFLFAMLLLTLGDNLVMMFVGWEGVGLCSYLLIGFWYETRANAVAGMKAFIFNRVGDLGFLLGIFTLFAVFGTVSYVAPPVKTFEQPQVRVEPSDAGEGKTRVILPDHPGLLDQAKAIRHLNVGGKNANIELGRKLTLSSNLDLSKTMGAKIFPDMTVGYAVMIACLLLFVGAMGKSAQLPLYAWLPDAMAGPTPVSALIHAATMVTAGVYMVTRLHPLFAFSQEAMLVVAAIGACTALFAALVGLTQTDIKKVLAYSTVSQLGYMFLGAGIGAFSLAMFHVVTHAFFKALLFLGAGSVIHGMSDEQDMRKMGGLRKKMPITFITMLIGGLALAGFPFTSGWYSKDAILAGVLAKAHEAHHVHSGFENTYYLLYAMGIVGAFCTAFYTFRLIGLTFFGKNRASEEVQAHIHESPPVMTVPLVVLAALALLGGAMYAGTLPGFLATLPPTYAADAELVHHAHVQNLWTTGFVAFAGIGLACFLYIIGARNVKDESKQGFVYKLSLNKFYLEKFYDNVVTGVFGFLCEAIYLFVEVFLIDFLIVSGTAFLAKTVGRPLRRLQSGLVNSYATAILVGALVILYLFLRGEG